MSLSFTLRTLFSKNRRRPRHCTQPPAELLEIRALLSPLIKGGISSGSIASAGEVDTWTFEGAKGDRIQLISEKTSSASGFSVSAQVFNPSGSRLASFSAGSNTVVDLNFSGSYTVQVRDSARRQTGTYSIGLEGINPISPNPVALMKGGIVSGSILASLEKDQFTFTAKPGDRYEIITASTATIVGFRAHATVFAPSGSRIVEFFPGQNIVLQDFEETGTYMVQVRDDSYKQTGSYTIGLEGIKPLSPNPVALVKGGIVSGSILRSLEKDQFTFTAKPGERHEIITTSTATVAGFKAYTVVFAPSGTRIAQFGPGHNIVLQDFKETGTYMVQVRDDNYTRTGTYTIGLEGINPISPNARTLTPSTTVSRSINAASQKDQWIISVPVGKKLSITLSGTAIDSRFEAYAEVYNSAGRKIGAMRSGTSTFAVPAGVYLIQVRDNSLFSRGEYKLRAWLV